MKCEEGHTMAEMVAKWKKTVPEGTKITKVKFEACPICGGAIIFEGDDLEKFKNPTKEVNVKDYEEEEENQDAEEDTE